MSALTDHIAARAPARQWLFFQGEQVKDDPADK